MTQHSPQILKPSPSDPTRYRVRWVDHTGAKKQRSFRRKRDAVAYRDKLVEQISRGLSTTASKLTIKMLADEWWDAYASGPSISENTRSGQFVPALKLRILPYMKQAQIGMIDRKAIDAFIAWMGKEGCKPPTIRATLNTLSSMFQRAVEWDYVAVNPVRGARRPKEVAREGVVYEPAEVYKIAEAMRFTRDSVIVVFAAFSGLRESEVFDLKWRDVDLDDRQLRVFRNKTQKWTTVPLFDPAWRALALWETMTPWPGKTQVVFPSRNGTSLNKQQAGWLARRWRPACAKAGRLSCSECGELITEEMVLASTPFVKNGPQLTCVCGNYPERNKIAFTSPKFHDLRHTFGSLAVLATGDVVQVAEWMGHADPSMLMRRYKHQLARGRERAIGQVNDLIRSWS